MAEISSRHFTHLPNITETSKIFVYETDEGIFIDSEADDSEIGTVCIKLSTSEACNLVQHLIKIINNHHSEIHKRVMGLPSLLPKV